MDNMVYEQYRALIKGEHRLSVLANTSAFLNEQLHTINWVGFYLNEDNKLILGPFQGKVACYTIPIGKGVCGTAAKLKETVLVKNVHEFKGHIACDSASNSEIVVPMIKDNELIGVLDIDSPILNRFDEKDQEFLEKIVDILIEETY